MHREFAKGREGVVRPLADENELAFCRLGVVILSPWVFDFFSGDNIVVINNKINKKHNTEAPRKELA